MTVSVGSRVAEPQPGTIRLRSTTAGERLVGLDGLRGLAVAAVVGFHLWPDAVPAGFLGVSVFFTLSGFLITRLLLAEHDRTNRIDLRGFWSRRFRRLLPAALATLLCVAVVWTLAGWASSELADDLWTALLDVANWHRISIGDSYGVRNEQSPLLHMWSLSIEEQLYVALPIVVALAVRRRLLGPILVGLFVASWAYARGLDSDAVVVYYSTFTRAAEVLAGAGVAVALHRRTPSPVVRSGLGVAGALALAALGVLVATTSLGEASYYSGGLAAVGLVSAVAVAGVATSTGPLARALGVAPLVWLGGISYALYLVHWPVLVALRRAGIDDRWAPVLTLLATLPIAAASTRFLETPIRRGAWRRSQLLVAGAGVGIVVLVFAAVAARAPSASPIDFAATQRLADEMATAPTIPPDSASVGAPAADTGTGAARPPVRVAVFGDSTALTLGMGMVGSDPRFSPVVGFTAMGCPIGGGGAMRGDVESGNDSTQPAKSVDECGWDPAWVDALRTRGPLDAAVIYTGGWDVSGRRVPALGERWMTVGDPAYDAWLRDEMLAATDALATNGARRVVWLTLSAAGEGSDARVVRFNELLAEVVEARADVASLVDLDGWLHSTGEDDRLRPDGIHMAPGPGGTSEEVGRRWLLDAILRAIDGATLVR